MHSKHSQKSSDFFDDSFLQLGCFDLDITSFCIASHKAGAFLPPVNILTVLHAGFLDRTTHYCVHIKGVTQNTK